MRRDWKTNFPPILSTRESARPAWAFTSRKYLECDNFANGFARPL
jgi:hypothetical protein